MSSGHGAVYPMHIRRTASQCLLTFHACRIAPYRGVIKVVVVTAYKGLCIMKVLRAELYVVFAKRKCHGKEKKTVTPPFDNASLMDESHNSNIVIMKIKTTVGGPQYPHWAERGSVLGRAP